nr:hypothetical protein Z958_p0138 [Clostridium novyi B str. NCTC 9691]
MNLVRKAQKNRIKLTKTQIREIKNLYRDVALDIEKELKRSKKNINERWLLDYYKEIKKEIRNLNKILKPSIKKSMLESAELANDIQLNFFNLLDNRYNLNIKDSFSSMFSKIPEEVIQELISGEFYKDGKGLSKRLWNYELKNNKNIDYVIKKGIMNKTNAYDIAKDLECYVDPFKRKKFDSTKYPGASKNLEYNSVRLAVTSISHAYQLSMRRSCKANPFIDRIQWHTSNSHRGPCALCKSREGKKYKIDELPLDHPMGVCYFTPVLEQSLEEIGNELHDWLYGASNKKLDNWYKEYGINYL